MQTRQDNVRIPWWSRGDILAAMAGLSFVGLELSIRAAAPHTPADADATVRLVPIIVVAWVMALRRGSLGQLLSLLRGWHGAMVGLALFADGFLNLYLGVTLKVVALQHGSVVIALTAIEAGNVFGTALIVRRLFQQRLLKRIWLGLFLVTAGTWAASLGPSGGGPVGATIALALAAGLCFAISAGAMSYALRQGVTLWTALALSSTVGFIATLVTTISAGQSRDLVPLVLHGGSTVLFLGLSGLCYALALVFLTRAYQRTSAVVAEAISGANGPVAAVSAGYIFGPLPGWDSFVGVILVLIGSYVVRLPGSGVVDHGFLKSRDVRQRST